MATYTVMSDDDNLSRVLEELEGDFEFEEALDTFIKSNQKAVNSWN